MANDTASKCDQKNSVFNLASAQYTALRCLFKALSKMYIFMIYMMYIKMPFNVIQGLNAHSLIL